MRGLERQQVAALTNFVGCFFFLLLLFFSPSALNDLAGPVLGPWPEKHIPKRERERETEIVCLGPVFLIPGMTFLP